MTVNARDTSGPAEDEPEIILQAPNPTGINQVKDQVPNGAVNRVGEQTALE